MNIEDLTIKEIKQLLSQKEEQEEKTELQQIEEIKNKILFYNYDQYINSNIKKIGDYYFLVFTKKRRSQSKKHKGQIMADLYVYYKEKNISKILQTMEGCHYSSQKITIVKKLIDYQKIIDYIES